MACLKGKVTKNVKNATSLCTCHYSDSIVLDQAKKLVEEKRLPEDFLSTADDLDNIAQKYKDEIRNQTVKNACDPVSTNSTLYFSGSFRMAIRRNPDG